MRVSLVIRRTHMYAALFLTPWVLVYALSTIAMNHRGFLDGLRGGTAPRFEVEKEMDYPAAFSDDTRPWMAARQILQDLGLEGAHGVRGRMDRGNLIVNRADPVTPRRITYMPGEQRLRVERVVFETPKFLERLHRRRGYRQDYLADDLWAFSVDLFIVAMLFWFGSGLWMWWELSATRRWGALCTVAGLGIFLFFVFTI